MQCVGLKQHAFHVQKVACSRHRIGRHNHPYRAVFKRLKQIRTVNHRDVDAPHVGRLVVNEPVIVAAQRRSAGQILQDLFVFNLAKTKNSKRFIAPQSGNRLEQVYDFLFIAFFRPMVRALRCKSIVISCGIVEIIEKILDIVRGDAHRVAKHAV